LKKQVPFYFFKFTSVARKVLWCAGSDYFDISSDHGPDQSSQKTGISNRQHFISHTLVLPNFCVTIAGSFDYIRSRLSNTKECSKLQIRMM
jgi:hypothetical protein